MPYTLRDLAWVLGRLEEHGIKGVIVGSTIVELELRRREFVDDIDLFVKEPSPMLEEDKYTQIASEEKWGYSYTSLGTPKLVARTPRGSEVVVEFYENILDFYIPEEMLARAGSKKIEGRTIKLLKLEDYIVLKAKAARETDVEDLRIIREYVEERKLKVDEKALKQALEFLPEEDRSLALSKLRETGFID